MIVRLTPEGEVLYLRAAQEDHSEEGDAGDGDADAGGGEHKIGHAEEECIHLLEEGNPISRCQEAPNPILPPVSELVWAVVAFAALFFFMKKFGYPAIKKTMDARTDRIRDNLDEADRTRAEAHTILEEYQRQLADARSESSRIIEEARQTADQLRRDLMARAEADVAELRQRNAEELASAQDRALADLRGQVATIAIDVAERVVQRNLDRDTNQALVESFIREVTTDQAGARG